jgi:hypothetical protein
LNHTTKESLSSVISDLPKKLMATLPGIRMYIPPPANHKPKHQNDEVELTTFLNNKCT